MKNPTKAYTCIQSLGSLGITKLLTTPTEAHLTQTTSETKTQSHSSADRIMTHSKIPSHTPSGESTQKNYKKELNGLDNHDGMITHLETNIMECEAKWALGSITMNKGSGGDGIPAELFQIQKDNDVKVLHSIGQQTWKTQQWPRTRKGQFSFQPERRAMPRNAQTTTQLHSFHMTTK